MTLYDYEVTTTLLDHLRAQRALLVAPLEKGIRIHGDERARLLDALTGMDEEIAIHEEMAATYEKSHFRVVENRSVAHRAQTLPGGW